MKVKDLITFLSTLEQDAELYFADYYYDSREGFSPDMDEVMLSQAIVKPELTEYNKHLAKHGNIYLVDFNLKP